MYLKGALESKTVLVTGAASGIGKSLCHVFAEQGAVVYAADIDEQGLKELRVDHSGIYPIRLDVTSREDFSAAIDLIVGEHKKLDILINNAGIALAGAFIETPWSDIEKLVNTNLWSVFFGSRLAYEQMVTQGFGQIINVSSSAGLMPVPNQTVYTALKHAVTGFTHALREEAAQHNIQVSSVFPGLVATNIFDQAINIKDYDLKTTMKNTGMNPVSSRQAAEEILTGVLANKRSIIFPLLNRIILKSYQILPRLMTRVAVTPLAKQ